MTIPALPAEGSTAWYGHYGAIDTAVRAIHLGPSNGSDDTATINAALANPLGLPKRVVGMSGQTYKAGSVIRVPSNVTLSMSGCRVVRNNAATGNVIANSGTTPTATGTGSITVAGTVLTTAVAAVVGQTVIVAAAGGNASSAGPLVALVTAVGAGTLTLSAAAGNTATNVAVSVYTRDKNVTIEGGTWVSASAATGGVSGYIMYLRHIDGLTVRNIVADNTTAQGYTVSVGDVTNYLVENISGYSSWDGVHVNGPARFGTIRSVKMTAANADIIGVTCREYANFEDTSGDISDLRIEDTHQIDANSILLLAGHGTTISRVVVDGLYGRANGYCGRMLDDEGSLTTVGGRYEGIVWRNIRSVPKDTALLYLDATGMGDVRLEGFDFNEAALSVVGQVVLIDGGTLDHLHISGGTVRGAPNNGKLLYVNPSAGGASIKSVTIDNTRMQFRHNGQSLVFLAAGANIENLFISNVITTDTTGAQLVHAPNSSSLANVFMDNVRASGHFWLCDVATVTNIYLDNLRFSEVPAGGGWLNLRAGSNVRLVAGAVFANNTFVGDPGANFAWSATGASFKCDISRFTAPQLGDLINNTNAGLTCGAGLVVRGATTWKNVHTELTF